MQLFWDFFNSSGFMPHGYCFLWLPSVLWLHVISDAVIAAAFFMIPSAFFYLMRKRSDLPYRQLLIAFSSFILLCGFTHIAAIWVLWFPDYAMEGLLKAATAVVSLATVFVLWYAIPRVLNFIVTADDRERADQFQLLANTLPQLAWMADDTGWIFWYNDKWYDYTGTKLAEMAGWGWQSVYDPQKLSEVLHEWQLSISSGKPFEMVSPIRAADGSFRPFLTRVNPILGKQEKIAYWFGTSTDITQQHEAELAVRTALLQEETERTKLLALVECTPSYIGMADLQGNLRYHNRAARTLVGLSEGYDMSTLTLSDMHPAWALNRLKEEAIPAVYKNGVWTGETALLHRDGREIPVIQVLTLHRDRANRPDCFTTIIQDISESKAQQEELRTTVETFRSAMHAAPIGMALVSPEGMFLKVNPALCALLGYDEADLLALDPEVLGFPEDMARELTSVHALLHGEIQQFQMEKRYFRKDRQVIWALLSVSLVRSGVGAPSYFVAQIQDITEQKEVERIKSEFISVVSHELRTPLTSIRGSLGLLTGTMAELLPEKVKPLLEIAHNNCERLNLLINDILDIDKIAIGEMRFDIKTESVGRLIESAVKANAPYADKVGVTFAFQRGDEDLFVCVDANRFTQILSNLLSNAAKFSPIDGSVEINAMALGPNVRVSIRDYGAGIPQEFRARIFGKFSQADSSATRIQGGSGLGLHITKQFVENMNGKIGFDSEIGDGSTFWVEFQRAPSHAHIESAVSLLDRAIVSSP